MGSWWSSAVPGGYLVLGVLLSCSGQLKMKTWHCCLILGGIVPYCVVLQYCINMTFDYCELDRGVFI